MQSVPLLILTAMLSTLHAGRQHAILTRRHPGSKNYQQIPLGEPLDTVYGVHSNHKCAIICQDHPRCTTCMLHGSHCVLYDPRSKCTPKKVPLVSGWSVIQQRVDASVDFNRNWKGYVNSFGTLHGNFWIGLENMHQLTVSGNMELMVELYTFKGEYAYAKYDHFAVGDAASSYTLSLSGYSGNAGDSFDRSNNHPFTTFDRENDSWPPGNCAIQFGGGWWHEKCFYCNLNGKYRRGHHDQFAQGINWYTYKGFHYSYKKVVMKIRQK